MAPIPEAILCKVELDARTGCWVWKGDRDKDGYGRVHFAGRTWQVHRLVYSLTKGAIPAGLVIDHRECDNPSCCRPEHLVACSNRENTLRGRSFAAVNFRKTACVNGHPFDDANTYRWRGHRSCRACNVAAVSRYKAGRRREAEGGPR